MGFGGEVYNDVKPFFFKQFVNGFAVCYIPLHKAE
jgi:hypothetical protein